ncbi:MAG: FG-GAP repeat domain-containing protein, partial [Candidatus Kapaibacterium sp.]
FFDADNDGDLDLYVVSGGDEMEPDDPLLQDRLYHNNGKGKFTRAKTALPQMLTSGSSVVAADYDLDGDLDLFVGGRIIPGLYAAAPRSYLLQNQGGNFSDVTSKVSPELLNPGLVSSALWTDYDNDGDPDLMIVGEWMTPRLYRNQNNRFTDVTNESGLAGYEGWWNSLIGADLDNDGDVDYVAGNLGLNTKPELTCSNQYPLRLYINDFDGNGSRDFVISYYYQGKEYPTRNKTDIAMQMGTYIKRKFPSFAAFARATIPEIFSEEKLQSATVLSATNFASYCFMNNGDGTFSSIPLPVEGQISPVHGMVVEDYDGDNNLDILLTQNFYGPDGTVVQYDAGIGQLLRGVGNGHFEPIPLNNSGFLVSCDARSMARIRLGTSDSLCIFSTCNGGNAITHTWNVPGTKIVSIPVSEKVTHAILTMKDGRKQRREIYAGSGYISQNGQSLVLSPGVKAVELYRGKKLIETITP